jgi:putative addiction module killer protein
MIREIISYGDYYDDFMATLSIEAKKKIHYILDLLSVEDRVSAKFVKHIRDGIYEIRAMYDGNIYRIFFIFDEGKIVVLFNGFQKKTQETPESEIKKALKIKAEYYGDKQNQKCQ